MGKLMRVTRGAAFLLAVNIRPRSLTVGNWFGIEASAINKKMVWAPASVARGFGALSDGTEVQYLYTGVYNSKAESAIRWDDPPIAIEWPIRHSSISDKDRNATTLVDWLASQDTRYFTCTEQATIA